MPCGFPSFLTRRRSQSIDKERLNQIQSWFYNLPLELVFMICDHLDQTDRYCLSLTTLRWRHALSTRTVKPTDMLRGRQLDLLSRYARQYSDRFYCQSCRKLHLYGDVIPPGIRHGRFANLECQQLDKMLLQIQLPSGPEYAFYFVHLQLVMDEWFWPGTGLSLTSLNTTAVHEPASATNGAQLTSVDAQIIEGELYLRVQMWITSDPANPQDTLVDICAHKGLNPKNMQLFMSTMNWYAGISDTVQQSQTEDELGSHELWVCWNCKVECVIQTKSLPTPMDSPQSDPQRSYIVITKYLSLGRGRSPTDANCWRHRGWRFNDVLLSNGSRNPRLMQLYENEGKGLDLGEVTRSNEQVLSRCTYLFLPFVKLEYEPSRFCWINQINSEGDTKRPRRSTISRIKSRLSA